MCNNSVTEIIKLKINVINLACSAVYNEGCWAEEPVPGASV